MSAKKGLRNIIMSILNQLVVLGLGLIIPRLVLVNLGSEANGLLNSISTVLIYVALLEAGVGGASLQALYGPAGRGDKQSISGILAATNHFYKRTGSIYFVVIILLTFIFPFTIQSELPKLTVMLVMLLSGMPGAVSYFFQGKFNILLQAEGKSYILTGLTTVIYILTSVSKIILLLSGFDIIALQVMYFVFSLMQVAFIMIYMKHHYKWLDLSVKPDYDAISQSKNVLVHQISGMIFGNTDVLVLTFFCGLKTVSVYAMYTMLYSIVKGLISHFGGFYFILGQTFNTDRKRFLQLHDAYELYKMTLTFCLFCIANIFILPFLKLYTGGITDISYIDNYLPYLFVATFLLSNGRSSSLQAIIFAGHYKQTQSHALIESIINMVVSLVCVNFLGIYGVLLGTVAALLYRTNIMIFYANRHILNRSMWITYRRWLLNLVLFVIVTVSSKYVFNFITLNTYPRIVFWAGISCVVIIPIFFVTVSLIDKETYRFSKELLVPYLRSALGKIKHAK